MSHKGKTGQGQCKFTLSQNETTGLLKYVNLRMLGQMAVGNGRALMVAGDQIDRDPGRGRGPPSGGAVRSAAAPLPSLAAGRSAAMRPQARGRSRVSGKASAGGGSPTAPSSLPLPEYGPSSGGPFPKI